MEKKKYMVIFQPSARRGLIEEGTNLIEASRQLGHSSSQITLEHYIARPSVAADHAELLQALADGSPVDQGPASQAAEGPNPHEN